MEELNPLMVVRSCHIGPPYPIMMISLESLRVIHGIDLVAGLIGRSFLL